MSLRDKHGILHCEALCALTLKGFLFWWNQVSKVYEWRYLGLENMLLINFGRKRGVTNWSIADVPNFYWSVGQTGKKIHVTIDMSMVTSGLSQKFAVPSTIMPCAKFLAHIKGNFQDKMTVMNNSSQNSYTLSQQISTGNWPDGENDTLCLICPAEQCDCAENLGGVWHNMACAELGASGLQYFSRQGNGGALEWSQKHQENDQTSLKGQQNFPSCWKNVNIFFQVDQKSSTKFSYLP